jgi:hypothetical protein
MRKRRYTEDQIIGIMKHACDRDQATDLCREHGIRYTAVSRQGVAVAPALRAPPVFLPSPRADCRLSTPSSTASTFYASGAGSSCTRVQRTVVLNSGLHFVSDGKRRCPLWGVLS